MTTNQEWFDPSDLFIGSQENKQKFRGIKRSATKKNVIIEFSSNNENKAIRKSLKFTSNNFEPQKLTDLAISGQKKNELKDWFVRRYTGDVLSNPFLLLRGPSGSAKTTSLMILAKEYNVKVIELDSAMGISFRAPQWPEFCDDNRYEIHEKRLQLQLEWLKRTFRDLVFRCGSLLMDEQSSRIILFESLNDTIQNNNELIDCLHEQMKYFLSCDSRLKTTLVFIISDFNTEMKLFPKDLQTELNICVINFCPITEKILLKTLTNSLKNSNELSLLYSSFSNESLKRIASSACGDVRSVFNNLMFLQPFDNSTKKKKSSKNIKKADILPLALNYLGTNTERISIVHAIAKVLYSKRLPEKEDCVIDFMNKYPNFDKKKLRNPLKEDNIEQIFENINIDSRKILEWTQENYVDFLKYDDFETATDILDIMSFSESSFNDFELRDTLEPVRLSVLVKGLMFNLNKDSSSYHQASNVCKSVLSSRHSLRGPVFYKYFKEYSYIYEIAEILLLRGGFVDIGWKINLVDFILDFIPFIASGFSRLCNEQMAKYKTGEPVRIIGNFTMTKSLKTILEHMRKLPNETPNYIEPESDIDEFKEDYFVDDHFSDSEI